MPGAATQTAPTGIFEETRAARAGCPKLGAMFFLPQQRVNGCQVLDAGC